MYRTYHTYHMTLVKSAPKKSYATKSVTVWKEKSFHLLEGTVNIFGNLKGQNGQNCSIFRTTVFYKQILDFHCPSKILFNTLQSMKFRQHHWSQMPAFELGCLDKLAASKINVHTLILIYLLNKWTGLSTVLFEPMVGIRIGSGSSFLTVLNRIRTKVGFKRKRPFLI